MIEPQGVIRINKDLETLKRCNSIKREIALLNKMIEEDREKLYGSIVVLDDQPKAKGSPYGKEYMLLSLIDKEDKRVEIIAEYQKMLDEAEELLKKVIDSTRRNVIRLCYIEQLPIWRVAELCFVSERTVSRIKKELEESKEVF